MSATHKDPAKYHPQGFWDDLPRIQKYNPQTKKARAQIIGIE